MSNIKDYIFEHLDNLGELERPEFNYLSNNVEEFYSESSEHNSLILNEKAFLQLSHLFKVISFEDFPREYDLTEVKIRYINGKVCLINKFKQICYEEDDKLYITPLFIDIDDQEFRSIRKDIIKTLANKEKWKQYNLYGDYKNCSNYAFEDKCAISILNGDIINLLKSTGANNIRDIDMVIQAIEFGGTHTESYDSDYDYYVTNGFMPVSACKWDDEHAPIKWLQLNGFILEDRTIDKSYKNIPDDELKYPRQDIIFYIYTSYFRYISYSEWLATHGYSDNYDQAKDIQLKECNKYYNK